MSKTGKVDHRRVILPLSLATGLSLLGDTALYTVLPSNAEKIGLTVASIGILLSVNRFVRLALNGPFGVLVDKWPRRRLFIPAVFLGAISTASYALAQEYWLFLAGRLLWGISWAGLWVSGNAIVLDITGLRDRGGRVGSYHLAFYLGASSGAIFGGLLTDLVGFRVAMGIAAGLTFFGALQAWYFLPETRPIIQDFEVGQSLQKETSSSSQIQLSSAIALFSLNRLAMAGTLFATFGLFLLKQMGETIRVLGSDFGVATVTGLALGASTLIGMVSAPSSGFFSDRFRNRWGVASGGLLVGATGFGLISTTLPLAIILGLPCASFASASNQSISTALIGDISRKASHGRSLGLLFTLGDLASAIGPPLAYGLEPELGLPKIYLIISGLFVVMAFFSVLLARQHGQDQFPI